MTVCHKSIEDLVSWLKNAIDRFYYIIVYAADY